MFAGFETRRIRANGIDIALVKGGKGPPLLLLHGHPQTHVIWHKVAEALATRFTVVASHLSSFDACRVLVQFLEARVLRRR